MGAGAHCDTGAIDDGCDIVGCAPFNSKDTIGPLSFVVPMMRSEIDFAQPFMGVSDQTVFVGADAGFSD